MTQEQLDRLTWFITQALETLSIPQLTEYEDLLYKRANDIFWVAKRTAK